MNLNQKAAFLSVAFTICSLSLYSPLSAKANDAQPNVSHTNLKSIKVSAEKTVAEKPAEEPAVPVAASSGKQISQDIASFKDQYILEPGTFLNNKEKVEISARKTWETGHAGVYINNKEVVRFRSELDGQDPLARAKRFSYNLHKFLLDGGNPRNIKPGLDEKSIVIRAGEDVLINVDSDSKQAKQVPQVLAMNWTNRIREALGADTLDRNRLASRGMMGTSREELEDYRSTGVIRSGMASWYGPGFHGRRAANGSRYNMYELTAAHRTLPFGTRVRVLNQRTGKSCVVKITDRGPFHGNRIIDLSKGAASAIGLLSSGVSKVSIEILSPLLRR